MASCTDIDPDKTTLLDLLHIIGTITQGYTLSPTSRTVIPHGTWSTAAWRWVKSEKRSTTVNFISDNIRDALRRFQEDPETWREPLREAAVGITYLKETYAGDQYISDLTTDILESIYAAIHPGVLGLGFPKLDTPLTNKRVVAVVAVHTDIEDIEGIVVDNAENTVEDKKSPDVNGSDVEDEPYSADSYFVVSQAPSQKNVEGLVIDNSSSNIMESSLGSTTFVMTPQVEEVMADIIATETPVHESIMISSGTQMNCEDVQKNCETVQMCSEDDPITCECFHPYTRETSEILPYGMIMMTLDTQMNCEDVQMNYKDVQMNYKDDPITCEYFHPYTQETTEVPQYGMINKSGENTPIHCDVVSYGKVEKVEKGERITIDVDEIPLYGEAHTDIHTDIHTIPVRESIFEPIYDAAPSHEGSEDVLKKTNNSASPTGEVKYAHYAGCRERRECSGCRKCTNGLGGESSPKHILVKNDKSVLPTQSANGKAGTMECIYVKGKTVSATKKTPRNVSRRRRITVTTIPSTLNTSPASTTSTASTTPSVSTTVPDEVVVDLSPEISDTASATNSMQKVREIMEKLKAIIQNPELINAIEEYARTRK